MPADPAPDDLPRVNVPDHLARWGEIAKAVRAA